ncbi:probable esterase PIR7A isoform X2 [Phragmites australis]|uniref:probable esterase PIR7A isoform X2 n=1 Tax=Phragmites australis TaxID=29695 RepID=UPI002D79F9FB|nr:probable esterase PIR7A isoform X2 [Phragmites australis]
MEKDKNQQQRHHFVLVHGLCHGAWCWYKVATVLQSAGHRVTALDLVACGASAVRAEEVRSFEEFSRPLLDAVANVPPGEKVVLVGHSFGGHNISLAMERYPDKVAVAVFVSAAMPTVGRPMSDLLEQNLKASSTTEFFLDSTFGIVENDSGNPVQTFLLGPEFLSRNMYQLSPPEAGADAPHGQRDDRGERSDGGQVRGGEPRVRHRRRRQDVAGGGPAAGGGLLRPRRGGEGHRGS